MRIELIPWTQLTRLGMPDFRVGIRPLNIVGVIYQPGEFFPVGALPSVTRVKQLYEQRAIVPIPETVVRTSKHPLKSLAQQLGLSTLPPMIPALVKEMAASAPVKLASARVANGIPDVAVPVTVSAAHSHQPPSAQSPSAGRRHPGHR